MRVLLTGADGQLGGEIAHAWNTDDVIRFTRASLDVTDRAAVEAAVTEVRPGLVLNAAAFTNVDACETAIELAFATNAFGPMHLADACREHGATLLHISTDYVFDGTAQSPYSERDTPHPCSIYGLSKATGEQLVRGRLSAHYIVRTAGLYGGQAARPKPTNFVDRMLQLAQQGQSLRVVDDQVTAPTSAGGLATTLREIVAGAPYGTYHATNAGECSWFEFARAIFELSGVEASVTPISSAEYGAPAMRPAYSVLANNALAAAGITPMRHWREALAEYLRDRSV